MPILVLDENIADVRCEDCFTYRGGTGPPLHCRGRPAPQVGGPEWPLFSRHCGQSRLQVQLPLPRHQMAELELGLEQELELEQGLESGLELELE